MTSLHDKDLASPDDIVRAAAVSRIVDRYQGDVLFCDDPDCTLYVTSPYRRNGAGRDNDSGALGRVNGDSNGTLQRVSERGLLCAKHR